MAKDGWEWPQQHFKSLKGHQQVREFCIKLSMDRSGAWLKVKEKEELNQKEEVGAIQGHFG
eukprot:10019999-Alexandrium_andersonii.AAC.1